MKEALKSWETIPICILALEFIIFATANSKFLMPRVLFGSISDMISICIISLFVTFVMIIGGINIQAGPIVGLTSIVLGVSWQDWELNIRVATGLGIIVAALYGVLSGYFVAYCGVQPMVVTLDESFLFSGLALLVSNLSATESYKGINGFPDSFIRITEFKLFGVIPNQVLIFLMLAVTACILLHKTKYGRRIFLIGVNQSAAEYSGINSRLVIMSAYVLSAMSTTVAGIVLTPCLGTARSDIGATLTMPIITAVVLGGTLNTGGKGSVLRTTLTAVAIGVLRFRPPLCSKVSQQYLDIPVGLIPLVMVIGRSLVNSQKVIAMFRKKRL